MSGIALDIGNVICQVDLSRFTATLRSVLHVSEAEANFFLDHTQKAQDIGLTTVRDAIIYKYGVYQEETLQVLLDSWYSTVWVNPSMMQFIRSLLDDKVLVALLSNIGFEHLNYLKKITPDWFLTETITHMSCQVGARKPSKLFFLSFLQDHSDFKNALYLDDLSDNLQMGAEYGLRPFLFDVRDFVKLDSMQQQKQLQIIRGSLG